MKLDIIGIQHNSEAQIRPWLPNFTQYSDQVCRRRLGIDHIISSRAHWQKVKWDPHSMENTPLLRLGNIVPSLDGCKLCQMVSSGSLQAILVDILCTDSRTHYN